MAVINLKCPHCISMSQFRIIGFAPFPYDWAASSQHIFVSIGLVCPGCHKPVSALAKSTGAFNGQQSQAFIQSLHQGVNGSLITAHTPIETFRLVFVDHWPKSTEPTVPDHVPDGVAKAFLQAERNFPIAGHEEASGTMYRRSLEVGLHHKHPDMKGTLAQRIKKLVEDNILTKELGEWSDSIRLIGNDAAHADEVTQDDLVMARAFTDAVLRYIFTLPEQVRLRKVSS